MQECGSGTQRRHSPDPRRHVSNSIPLRSFLTLEPRACDPCEPSLSPSIPFVPQFFPRPLNFSISPPLSSFHFFSPSLLWPCSLFLFSSFLLATAHSHFPWECLRMRREILCIDRSACATPPPALRWRVKYSDEIRWPLPPSPPFPLPFHRNLNFVYRVISACIVKRVIRIFRDHFIPIFASSWMDFGFSFVPIGFFFIF